MKPFLPFFYFLFSFSVLFAQPAVWINHKSIYTGLVQTMPNTTALDSKWNMRIGPEYEPGTLLQKQIQIFGGVKKTANPGDIVYLPDTVIERSISIFDSTRYIFTYNVKGLFTRGTIEKSGASSNGEWVNNELDTCTYDANGNMLSVVIRLWTNGAWTNSSLVKYTYDANGHILTESQASWLNDQWINTYRNTYTYDASGNKLTALAERWLNNQWTNTARFSWTYDAMGNNLTDLYEQWLNEQWTNSRRFTKTYNGKGDNLKTLNESWTNGQWENTLLDSCVYNSQGNRLSEHIKGWVADHWKDSLLEKSSYNGNGKMLTDTTYTYANGQIKVFMENIFSYDASGNCISTLTQGFFGTTFDPTPHLWCILTDTCAYDANGRLLNDIRRQFEDNGVYVPIRRYSYTYDALGNTITVSYKGSVLEWHMYDKWIFIIASNYFYLVYDFPYFVDTVHLNFTYLTMLITGVPDPPNSLTASNTLLQNYPNPFTSTTTIRYIVKEPAFVSLKVFDAMGKEVACLVNEQKPTGNYSIEWNAAGFEEGMYFCKMQSGNFCAATKMLKFH